ncbi:MAG: 30S ribosomal protein S6e [Candidatus Micrarchaeota archaeon]
MKLVINEPASGKSFQTEVPKDKEHLFIGHKIGEQIEAGALGAAGYTLKITGGSDTSGFPMRPDVSGPRRTGVLLAKGPGYVQKKAGERQKRHVRGSLISDEIMQVNASVVSAGSKPLAELFPPTAKKDEKKK